MNSEWATSSGMRMSANQDWFSRNPIWPEPQLASSPRFYDRRRAAMRFLQFVPSIRDERGAKGCGKLLSQLAGLREPVALEILGSNGHLDCQFVAQKRDIDMLRSSVASALCHSLLIEGDTDPLYGRYQEIKKARLSREYHFLDYCGMPPVYLPVFDMGLTGSFDIPLHLHGIFQGLGRGELGFFQLLFVPCRWNWARTRHNLLESDLFARPEDTFLKAGSRLTRQGGQFFAVALRVGGFVEKAKVRSFMAKMHSVVRGLAAADDRLGWLTRADYFQAGIPRDDHFYMIFNRVTFRSAMVISADELVVLLPAFGPASFNSIPSLREARRSHGAPTHPEGSGQVLGVNSHQGVTHEVRIGPHLPNEHLYIYGKSGYGKTTLMESLVLQHIEAGDGFAVIDPHGDLINRILPLAVASRPEQIVYFNPSIPEHLVPFNMLAHNGSPREKEHLRAELLDFFEELTGDRLGVNIEHVLNYSLVTLLSRPNSTIADIRRLLTDEAFRNNMVGILEDQELIAFWKREFPSWLKTGGLMTITNKLSPLLMPGSPVATVLSSPANELDFGSMMENRAIFLCDISRGKLTRRYSKLLGRLVVSRIAIAAMMRDLAQSLTPWHLYVDEVQDVPSASLVEILQGGRKFGLHLRLANQARHDLPDHLRRAASNAATTVAFAIDDVSERAEAEKFFDRKFTVAEIGSLPKGEAIVKMDGHVFNLSVPRSTEQMTRVSDTDATVFRRLAKPRTGRRERGQSDNRRAGLAIEATADRNTETVQSAGQVLEEVYDEI